MPACGWIRTRHPRSGRTRSRTSCTSDGGKTLFGLSFCSSVVETIVAQSLGTKYVLDAAALGRIRDILGSGGLVVQRTDKVYGRAADPFQGAAVEKVYAAKARPRDLAVSMSVADVESIFRFGERTPIAEAFCAKNLPGPYTVVLRATPEAPKAIVSKDGRLGLRVPAHPIPRLLANAFGPVTSTSANPHGPGSPSA